IQEMMQHVKPVTAEETFNPVAEAVIKGYDDLYQTLSEPITREDYYPPKYYELETDEERKSYLAYLNAVEATRKPVFYFILFYFNLTFFFLSKFLRQFSRFSQILSSQDFY